VTASQVWLQKTRTDDLVGAGPLVPAPLASTTDADFREGARSRLGTSCLERAYITGSGAAAEDF